MRRFLLGLAVLGCWSLLMGQTAQAQNVFQRPQLTPSARPTTSPYLNLTRGGSSSVNYYGVVRPQQETARSLQLLQQQLQTSPAALATPEERAATGFNTGHPTHFGNTGQYFPMNVNRAGTSSASNLGRR